MIDYKEIGDLIREYRKHYKMTQKELGKYIGVTESSIAKYEKGLTEIPVQKLAMLTLILDLPPLPRPYGSYVEEAVRNILAHANLKQQLESNEPKSLESFCAYYSYALSDYDISLSKNDDNTYTLAYKGNDNSLGSDYIRIPHDNLEAMFKLLPAAKKEVGRFLFLSLKDYFQSLENGNNVISVPEKNKTTDTKK